MSSIKGINNNMDYSSNLSSGKRIQSAADDASGLAIANKLESQSRGQSAGNENASAANTMLNVSDGAMSSITEYLKKMKELSIKALNSLNTDEDKRSIQKEISGYMDGITQVSKGTQFNTKQLLDGSMSTMDTATKADGTGMKIQMADTTLQTLGIEGYDVTGSFDMTRIDKAMDMVSSARSSAGAASNALDYASQYGTNSVLQQTGAQSRLEDLDMPKAISDQKKEEVLDEYQTMMLKKKMEDDDMVTKLLQ